jgi:D-serine deaminase-like pyridoxal phosphate-dependent protein
MSVPTSLLNPGPSEAGLKAYFINQRLEDVQTPAAIIDAAVVRKNCNSMLTAARILNVQFRAHVKSHKVSSA